MILKFRMMTSGLHTPLTQCKHPFQTKSCEDIYELQTSNVSSARETMVVFSKKLKSFSLEAA